VAEIAVQETSHQGTVILTTGVAQEGCPHLITNREAADLDLFCGFWCVQSFERPLEQVPEEPKKLHFIDTAPAFDIESCQFQAHFHVVGDSKVQRRMQILAQRAEFRMVHLTVPILVKPLKRLPCLLP
jgi:hypothetical protein